MMDTKIDWNYPQPRTGLAGMLDRFFGPGTTPAEAGLQALFSVTAGVALPIYAFLKNLEWTPIQYLVATLLAFDIVGGIVTNAASSAKRWYHRRGQGFRAHFGFVAFHVVYVFLVAWLFRSMDWGFLVAVSLYLLVAAYLVLKTPLYLQRPLAFGLLALSFVLSIYAFAPTPGLEWFVPFLIFKLVVGHLLREEPYRPERVLPPAEGK
jgi:hypothetical protein